MSILYKTASDRIVKEYQRGNLSPTAIKQLQERGMIRPLERYIEGLNKGTQNIINKSNKTNNRNTKIKTDDNFKDAIQLHRNSYGEETIHKLNPDKFFHRALIGTMGSSPSAIFNKKKARLLDAIFTRHEGYEELVGNKNLKEYKKAIANNVSPKDITFVKGIMLKQVHPSRLWKHIYNKNKNKAEKLSSLGILPKKINDKFYKITGNHFGPEVLAREAHTVSKIPYPNYTQGIKKTRHNTGEKRYLTGLLNQDPYERGLPAKAIKKLNNSKSTIQARGGILEPDQIWHLMDQPKPKSKIKKIINLFRR